MTVGEVRTLTLGGISLGNTNRVNGMAIMPNGEDALFLDAQSCIIKVSLSNFPKVATRVELPTTQTLSTEVQKVACIGPLDATTEPMDCKAALSSLLDGNATTKHTARYCWMDNSIAVTPDGTKALVTDTRYQRILSVTLATGEVSVLAGTPDSLVASIEDPFTRCSGNHWVEGVVELNEPAEFNYPRDIVISKDGATAYVADMCSDVIRKIRISDGKVRSIQPKATNSEGVVVPFLTPAALALDGSDYLYVASYKEVSAVYKVKVDSTNFDNPDASEGSATLVVGTYGGDSPRGYYSATNTLEGQGSEVQPGGPMGVAVSPDGSTILIADSYNRRVLQYKGTAGIVDFAWYEIRKLVSTNM